MCAWHRRPSPPLSPPRAHPVSPKPRPSLSLAPTCHVTQKKCSSDRAIERPPCVAGPPQASTTHLVCLNLKLLSEKDFLEQVGG